MNFVCDFLWVLEVMGLLIFDLDDTFADMVTLHPSKMKKVSYPLDFLVDFISPAGLNVHDSVSCSASANVLRLIENQVIELQIAKQSVFRELISLKLLLFSEADWFLRWSKRFYCPSILLQKIRPMDDGVGS